MNPMPQQNQVNLEPNLLEKNQHVQLHLLDNEIITLTGISKKMNEEIKRIKKEKAKVTTSLEQASARRDQFIQEVSRHQAEEAERAQEHIRKVSEEARLKAEATQQTVEVAEEFKIKESDAKNSDEAFEAEGSGDARLVDIGNHRANRSNRAKK